MENKIDWTRVKNDTCGNPRYVCHFLAIASDYPTAIRLANRIGGRKFHNKQYGGGIVFASYNLRETEEAIERVKTVETVQRFNSLVVK